MARPTKLSQTITGAICWRLANGDTFKAACRSVGVAPQTVYEWLQRGEGRHPTRSPTPRYVVFAQAIAPLIPDELETEGSPAPPNPTKSHQDDEFADAFSDTLKSEHERAPSEQVPQRDHSEPTPDASFADAQNRSETGDMSTRSKTYAEPQKRGENGEVSPRAWLSQRSRRRVSVADKVF